MQLGLPHIAEPGRPALTTHAREIDGHPAATRWADGSCTGCSARRCLGYGPELLDELSRVKVVHWEPAPTG
ncbi:MAG: hypothetical protein M3486_07255 [Actinomycetota bacterium]|nr:hypothetical protein [Actinomycetota bacterium]